MPDDSDKHLEQQLSIKKKAGEPDRPKIKVLLPNPLMMKAILINEEKDSSTTLVTLLNLFENLMNSLDSEELIEAMKQSRSLINFQQTQKRSDVLYPVRKESISRIPVSVKGDYLFIDLTDIQYIQSSGAYSIICTENSKYTTSKNLKYHEDLLSDNRFLRISNSHLINLDKVVKYKREDGGVVELQNETKILVSRSRKSELKKLLKI